MDKRLASVQQHTTPLVNTENFLAIPEYPMDLYSGGGGLEGNVNRCNYVTQKEK